MAYRRMNLTPRCAPYVSFNLAKITHNQPYLPKGLLPQPP
jgi:hypothetical protein